VVELALQKAIFAALTTALDGVATVHDHVPENQLGNFVVIGRHISTFDDILGGAQRRIDQVTLTIFSNYRGQKDVLTIIGLIRAAIHDTRPALDTGHCRRLFVQRADTAVDDDGATYVGSVILEAVLEL
jgi:hypothetical protein